MKVADFPLWWLSFVDEDEDRFLGVIIIRADCGAHAELSARLMNIHPGGECVGFAIPDEELHRVLPEDIGHLLHEEHVRKHYTSRPVREWQEDNRQHSILN